MRHRTAWGFAVAAIGGLVIVGAAWATPPGGNGRIAYVAEGAGEVAHLWTANDDGSDARDLTPGRRQPVSSVAWAPDGTRLAYTSSIPHPDDYEVPARWELRTIDADGSGDRRLVRFVGFLPSVSWSPDGAEIAYVGADSRSLQIFAARADGSGQRQVTHFRRAFVFGASWSPDGSRIAFSADFTPSDESWGGLWTVRADGSERRRVAAGDFFLPDWSPDGSRILAIGGGGLRVAQADGSGSALLLRERGGDWGAAWSPDGTRVVFSSHRWRRESDYDSESIGVVNADGTCPTRMIPDGFAPAWQPVPGGAPQASLRCADAVVGTRATRRFVQRGRSFGLVDTVRSAGTDPILGTTVAHRLPRGLEATAATPSQGTCTLGRVVRCALGDVPAGAVVTVRMTVRAASSGRWHEGGARVETASPDPDPSTNRASSRPITICDRLGGDGDDRIVGTARPDVLCGQGGADTIHGRGGHDTILAGRGRDFVTGGAGDDVLEGGGGGDRIDGGPGDDHIDGGSGSDALWGRSGNDMFFIWDGYRDWVDGGPGRDQAFVNDSFDVITRADTGREPPPEGPGATLTGRAAAFLAQVRG